MERDGQFDVIPYNPFGSLSLSQQRAKLPVFKVWSVDANPEWLSWPV